MESKNAHGLAGGAALNCTANGHLLKSRLFDEIYVQPAAGDDGSALGAALYRAAQAGEIGIRRPRRHSSHWKPSQDMRRSRPADCGRARDRLVPLQARRRGFLAKPFRGAELLRKTRELLLTDSTGQLSLSH